MFGGGGGGVSVRVSKVVVVCDYTMRIVRYIDI
jgi:hypothetical protein